MAVSTCIDGAADGRGVEALTPRRYVGCMNGAAIRTTTTTTRPTRGRQVAR